MIKRDWYEQELTRYGRTGEAGADTPLAARLAVDVIYDLRVRLEWHREEWVSVFIPGIMTGAALSGGLSMLLALWAT